MSRFFYKRKNHYSAKEIAELLQCNNIELGFLVKSLGFKPQKSFFFNKDFFLEVSFSEKQLIKMKELKDSFV
jgi:hypothetical protein